METRDLILEKLKQCNFKVSTDTRADVSDSVFFALSGEHFNGNLFAQKAISIGALAAVVDDPSIAGENICYVTSVLETLQYVAAQYRKQYSIPILVIGGSNGKTTSKELVREVLATTYRVHATRGSLNNHIGVPLSVLSMKKDTEIGVFEIGANHPGEHIPLLNIIQPTHVVVTNNGMDHLEGFGTPEGVRSANKEIYDWARLHNAHAFVHTQQSDLLEDAHGLDITPYTVETQHQTKLVGSYNQENIALALSIGCSFNVDSKKAIEAVAQYTPSSKRSERVQKNNITFVIDCYNANPSSMILALESFVASTPHPRGVILGDMLELGTYSHNEHLKIVEYVSKQTVDCIVYIGPHFKEVLAGRSETYMHFDTSTEAQAWFSKQTFDGYTFLLKGSRGITVEKVIE